MYPGFVIVPQANPFYEELAAVKDFVEQNPTEVVVLDMNHIYRYKGVQYITKHYKSEIVKICYFV